MKRYFVAALLALSAIPQLRAASSPDARAFIDEQIVYIGTYNLGPRSENLNTEVGVVIHDPRRAKAVATAIATDMRPENTWSAAHDDPDQFASIGKRTRASFWQLAPIKPLL